MALAHTILTVLAHAPQSGYDISKQFDEEVSYFWKASQQQIYRELGKMEDRGWVNYETIIQPGKPDKKVYHLTAEGKAQLLRWFPEPTTPTPIREDLMVKVLAGPYGDRQLLINEIKHRREIHQQQLTNCLKKEALFHNCKNPSVGDRFRYLTLRRGIRYEREWVEWCDEVMEFLEQMIEDYN